MNGNGEILRLLVNILRQGVVFETDEREGVWSVRVRSGELETDWIRWNTSRAGAFKIWIPPSVGEQVWFGCIGGYPETAFILGSAYSDNNPAPGTALDEIVITAPDGARFSYDAAAGALEVQGVKTARIQSSVSVTIDAPLTECTHHLKTRSLEVESGGELNGAFTGSMTINGVKPDDHDHGGVESGGSWTKGIQ